MEGIKVGILLLILQEIKEQFPNYYVIGLETKENMYDVTISTVFTPLSGRGFKNQYRIENNKAVFVKRLEAWMS